MKLAKVSLATVVALSLGSSAYAVDLGNFKDVKVSGEAKVWYQTIENDAANAADLFSQKSAIGDAALKLGVTGGMGDKMGYGVSVYGLDTLGLENNLVANTAAARVYKTDGSQDVAASVQTQWWAHEAYITYKISNTLLKIGRQELDTPLAFTEDWNVVKNSFDAAVAINTDIPNVTLVGAYVGKGNGQKGTVGVNGFGYGADATTVNGDGKFSSYVNDGAYAVGALTTFIPNVPLNLWYYNVQDVADALWADASFKAPMGIALAGQYGYMDPKGILKAGEETDAFGVKVSGKAAMVDLEAAYSSVSDGTLPMANTATGFKKTKLYTASIFSDGTVAAQPDTDSVKLGASTTLSGVKLAATYGMYESGAKGLNNDVEEVDLSVGAKVLDLDLKAFYIMRDWDKATSADQDIVRIIASYSF
ncbi:MAG: outer membrane porin, OprD family [Campylobacterales bacterium]|nr:outer membrane porin, OprD family [Campylobacterales bacterium]